MEHTKSQKTVSFKKSRVVAAIEAVQPFNDRGVIEKPQVEIVRPKEAAPQINVEVYAHPIGKEWIASTCWHADLDNLPGLGDLPHDRCVKYASKAEAIAAALNAAQRQVETELGEKAAATPWMGLKESLRSWVAKTIAQVRATDTSLPLHGVSVIDLCAGIGALALGFVNHGATVRLACELDADALSVYVKNLSPEATFANLCNLDSKGMECGILTIGMICTAFSKAGNQLGFADPILGPVYAKIFEHIHNILARAVVIECAPELLTLNDGRDAATLRKVLMAAGYSVKHRTVEAANFGVAQYRNRSFIVGIRHGEPVDELMGYIFPAESAPSAAVEDILDKSVPGDIAASRLTLHKAQPTTRVQKRARLGKIDGKGYQGYRIYSPKGLGATLTASGGGIARSTEAYLMEDGSARGLTPRETCRMQGLPEWFCHHDAPHKARKQSGNAVAVPVSHAIARQLGAILSPRS